MIKRVYVELLKEGKYKEAHNALEEACARKDDGYAYWFKYLCVRHECLFYRLPFENANDILNNLCEISATLGCPWGRDACGMSLTKDDPLTLMLIHKYNPQLREYYGKQVLEQNNDPYIGSWLNDYRHSANLGFGVAQLHLAGTLSEPESSFWLQKAMDQGMYEAYIFLAMKYRDKGQLAKCAHTLVKGKCIREIRSRIKYHPPIRENERLRELAIYGEMYWITARLWWGDTEQIHFYSEMFEECRVGLRDSLRTWFIICKDLQICKDIRILIAKLLIEFKYDAHLWRYCLSDSGVIKHLL